MQLLGPMLETASGQRGPSSFPARTASEVNLVGVSSAFLSPRSSSPTLASASPRMPMLTASQPSAFRPGVAVARGWHVNTGQHGLGALKRLAAAQPTRERTRTQ
jgi:hypothetical protein